ncbi:MAG TPA: hypothetical protein DDY13_09210 [Cytophagales bacterium]|jgi:uncharacterized tellurite resistance protein B-like protein|nr:hypothetical protein [Cytophagales bacterium]
MANLILIQALAELAYSIALADGELQQDEKEAFYKIIDEQLQEDAWSAKNRFKLLEERVAPNVEQTYRFAMFAIKTNRRDFDGNLKAKFLNVIEGVANSVDGLREQERRLIDKFKQEVKNA